MIQVIGINNLKAALIRLGKKSPTPHPSVVVGYKTNYAIYVHERTGVHHPVGEAKYLEKPARILNNNGTLGDIVNTAMQHGATLLQALYMAGLRLQRESQKKYVPVDTGKLKNSAFTEKDSI